MYKKDYWDALKAMVDNLSPRPLEATLVSVDGLFIWHHPRYLNEHEERYKLDALTAAMLSLGERIVSELRNGTWSEIVVRGTNGIIISMEVDKESVFSARFALPVSLDSIRSQLKTRIIEIKHRTLYDYNFILQSAIEKITPKPMMAAISSVDGLPFAGYPTSLFEIRSEESLLPSAMSTGLLSIGERITSELRNGGFREAIIRADDGFVVLMTINDDYVLLVKFDVIRRWDNTRSQLLYAIQKIKRYLPNER
jgi:predicted regulator of Ras-like GTPase activity (Roadblock/LC7/MglB family)